MMSRLLVLVILALTVLVVAPSAMAEHGPMFTESQVSAPLNRR